MGNYEGHSNSGIGFVGLLTIVFIVLKLTGVIGWSWWWVLSPIWISAILLIGAIIAFIIGWLIYDHFHYKKVRKEQMKGWRKYGDS